MRNLVIIALFSLLLFAVSCATPRAVQLPAVVEEPQPEPEPEPVVLVIPAVEEDDTLILPDNVSIRETERGRILVMDDKIIFKFADSNLPTNVDYILGDVIKTILDNNPNLRIVLEAHTSNRGIAYPYNYQLAVKRAYAGKQYLVNDGIVADRVIEIPLGESLIEFYTQKELRRYEFVLIESDEELAQYKKVVSLLDLKAETSDDIVEYNRGKEEAFIVEEETNEMDQMDDNNANTEVLIIDANTEAEPVIEENTDDMIIEEEPLIEENTDDMIINEEPMIEENA